MTALLTRPLSPLVKYSATLNPIFCSVQIFLYSNEQITPGKRSQKPPGCAGRYAGTPRSNRQPNSLGQLIHHPQAACLLQLLQTSAGAWAAIQGRRPLLAAPGPSPEV